MLAEGLGRTQLKLMMLALGGLDAGRRPGADPADAHDARSWRARCWQEAWGDPAEAHDARSWGARCWQEAWGGPS